jgi:hypothetical protein
MISLGVIAILAGAWYTINPHNFIDNGFIIFYWPIVGLLTGVSLVTRPADWRWRLIVSILAIFNFGLAFISYDTYNLVLVGIVGVLIGLIQIIQGLRNAGLALAALGVASAILGGLMIMNMSNSVLGLVIILCGIAAVTLTLVRSRRSSSAA